MQPESRPARTYFINLDMDTMKLIRSERNELSKSLRYHSLMWYTQRYESIRQMSILILTVLCILFSAQIATASNTLENAGAVMVNAYQNYTSILSEETLLNYESPYRMQLTIADTNDTVQLPDTLIGPPASPIDEQEQDRIGQNGDLEVADNDEDTVGVIADTARLEINSDDAAGDPGSEATGDTNGDANGDSGTSEVSETISDIESGLLDDVQAIISFRKIFLSILVLLTIYFLLRLITVIVDNLSERSTSNRLILKRIIPVLKITFWTLGIYFVVAGIIAPPIETIITVSASIGIAIGFASQDILRNVFGGIMIILDRPFQVGDKIDIGGQYGEVIEIGLRSVRIVTPDDSVVSLPNGELMNKAVSNANTSALDCQVVAEIYLPANVNIQEVRELAYRAAATSRYVYLNKPIVVNAINEIHYDRFIVKLRVKAYVLDIRYEFRFKSDMTELILRELSKREILASEVPEELPAGRSNK